MKLSKNDLIIPQALILCLDDVGWHNGDDLRPEGMASRSGIPRYHHPLDYRMLAELGKAIDMKIVCPLCLGDWDKDNILRGEVGMTHKPSLVAAFAAVMDRAKTPITAPNNTLFIRTIC